MASENKVFPEVKIDKIKKDCEFKKFHEYIKWGQEQNKENPGKFGTIEIYSYIINRLSILSNEMKYEEFDEFIQGLDKTIEF